MSDESYNYGSNSMSPFQQGVLLAIGVAFAPLAIVSMGLLAVGNGLLFAYVPVKLAAEGFAPWVAGAIITSLGAGGLIGCLLAGPLVRRVGHARVFAALAPEAALYRSITRR